MTIEERMDKLEKRNKRLTTALTVMSLAICAMVTMAATDNELKNGRFDKITAKSIEVEDFVRSKGFLVYDEKDIKRITIDPYGILVQTSQAPIEIGNGEITIRNARNSSVVRLGANADQTGDIAILDPTNANSAVVMGYGRVGGFLEVRNKRGEQVCIMSPDRNGKGVINVFNREGRGRTLESR